MSTLPLVLSMSATLPENQRLFPAHHSSSFAPINGRICSSGQRSASFHVRFGSTLVRIRVRARVRVRAWGQGQG